MAFGQPNYGYPAYGYQQNQYPQYYNQQPMVQPQVQAPIIPTSQQPNAQAMQNQQPVLLGKVVDGIDVVKATDIPIGSTYILPNASGSAIWTKGWNADGTTFIKEYKLSEQSSEENEQFPTIALEEKLNEIYDSIDELSKKIDKIKSSSSTASTTRKKRVIEEVDEDE